MSRTIPRRIALATTLMIVVAGSGLAATTAAAVGARSDIDEWTDREAAVVESIVQDVLGSMFADLEATAAFVEQTNPTPEQFSAFVTQIGAADNALGIGYAIEVGIEDADDHIAHMRAELGDFYDLYALDMATGLPVPVDRTGREIFYPVQMFSAGQGIMGAIQASVNTEAPPMSEMGFGIDAGFNDLWRGYIATAMAAEGRSLSPFTLLSAGAAQVDRVFFAAVPIRPADGRPNGVAATLMVEPLLLGNLDREALAEVEWEVVPAGGAPEQIESDYTQLYELELPGNPWQLAVAPTDEAAASLMGSPPWHTGLTAAVIAATLAGLLWLLAERRRQRARTARMRAVADEKDRFLATVSHELRTPLTVVAGFAEEIRDRNGTFDQNELEELLGLIVGETDELTAIVEDLLVAARSDISSVRVGRQPVALLTEARTAVHSIDPRAVVTGDDVSAIADPQRVRQILRNLLTNAQRYGGEEVWVEVSRSNNAHVAVVVSDNGDGIDPTKRDLIFRPYESAHHPGTETGSVGLGLYVSRALAEAMGGRLTYDYDGTWSRFCLSLPAADCTLAPLERTIPTNEEIHAF